MLELARVYTRSSTLLNEVVQIKTYMENDELLKVDPCLRTSRVALLKELNIVLRLLYGAVIKPVLLCILGKLSGVEKFLEGDIQEIIAG